MDKEGKTPTAPHGQAIPGGESINQIAKRRYTAPTIQSHPVDKLILGAGTSGEDEGSPFPRAS